MGLCGCGAEIPVRQGPGKPRKRCVTCSPPRNRAKATVHQIKPSPPAPRSLEDVVRGLLDEVGRVDCAPGAAALYAAALLDERGHSGASAAVLLKEMRSAFAEATKGASAGLDLVDELRARRANRRG